MKYAPLLLLWIAQIATAQNLVNNADFSLHDICPVDTALFDLFIQDWYNPNTNTSPDYYNNCNPGTVSGMPVNLFGSQLAEQGTGYAGIMAFNFNNYREYIACNLTEPLIPGANYCVEARLSLSDFLAGGGINELGFYFDTDSITSTNLLNENLNPQIENNNGPILDIDEWITVSGTFRPSQAHQWMAFGNFNNNQNTTGNIVVPGTNDTLAAYYYIDFISVKQLPEINIIPIPANFCTGEPVTLSAGGNSNSSYNWFDINDPSTILSTNPFYQIPSVTEQTIVLEYIEDNCAVYDTLDITPIGLPDVNFEIQNACIGSYIQIIDLSTSIPSDASYEWDLFNDGSIDATTQGGFEYFATSPIISQIKLRIFSGTCDSEIILPFEITQVCNPCETLLNLAPNSNTEFFTECPTDLNIDNGSIDLDFVTDWQQTTLGTPDYFHECFDGTGTNSAGVPVNTFGQQLASSGNGYIGFYALRNNDKREYITTELKQPLYPNNHYCISYNVSLAEFSSYGIENIGAYFSENPIFDFSTEVNLSYTPQITNQLGPIVDTENWLTIQGHFTPSDTLYYITIGNFNDNASTIAQVNTHEEAQPPTSNLSYYYIDDISVYSLPALNIEDTLYICTTDSLFYSVNNGYCSYQWTLSDGTIVDTDANLNYLFTSEGTFTLNFSASTAVCEIQKQITLIVNNGPQAHFEPVNVCLGEPSILINYSNFADNNDTYLWDFDNDGTIDSSSPGSATFTATQSGIYNISLTVIDDVTGCSSTETQNIAIFEECDNCDDNNLIINGSFELLTECPDSTSELALTQVWEELIPNRPVGLYNICSLVPSSGVPNNNLGAQNAYDGFGYAGLVCYSVDDYRSFMYQTLAVPMETGQQYCVGMQVNCADFSGNSIQNLGIYFSSDNPFGNNALAFQPQVEYSGNPLISLDEWVTVGGIITADEDYQFISIGNFNDNASTNVGTNPNGVITDFSYYYIDAITVFPVDFEIPSDTIMCYGDELTLTANTNLCNVKWINDLTNTILSQEASYTFNVTENLTLRVEADSPYCSGITETLTVEVIPQPSLGIDVNICLGETTTLTVQGVASDVVWTPATGLTNPTGLVTDANPTETTNYIVEAINNTNVDCPNTDTITIFVNQVTATINIIEVTICDGDEIQPIADGGDLYQWSPTTGISDPLVSNPILNPSTTTTYIVTVIDTITNCIDTENITINVDECDEGGPTWVDNDGNIITTVYDTIEINTDLVEFFPTLSDPDIPNGDAFNISFMGSESGIFNFTNTQYFYNPNQDFVGNDTIIVTACDQLFPIQCADLVIIITVYSPNEAPVLPDIVNNNIFITIFENETWQYCFNAIDPEGENIEFLVGNLPSNGTSTFVNDSCISYQPNNGFLGQDQFTVLACDEQGLCTEVNIFIEVLEAPEPPEIINISAEVFENVGDTICIEATDPNNNIATYEIIENPSNGTFTLYNDTCYIYIPNQSFDGTDSFTILVCDETDLCDEQQIEITVINAIEAVDDNYYVENGTTIAFLPSNNDIPEAFDSITIIQNPQNGIVNLNVGYTFTYMPNGNFVGLDSLIYQICAEPFGCDTAIIYIEVLNQFDATNDVLITFINTAITTIVTSNDDIPAETEITTQIIDNGSNGFAIINDLGSLTYTPNTGFYGIDTIIYEICSEGLGCETASVIITVQNAQNPNPEFDTAQTSGGISVNIDVLNNDSDPQGSDLTIVESELEASNGTVVLDENGELIYTPDEGFFGIDTLYYTISNQYSLTAESFVVIEVAGCEIAVPGAITPNNDSFNDFWEITILTDCPDFENNTVKIFNRWGNIVFEAVNYGSDGNWWSGNWQKNNEPLPSGTYYYVIEIEDIKKRDWQRGAVEIIR